MSNRRPSEQREQPSMPWSTVEMFGPEDLGVHSPLTPYLSRFLAATDLSSGLGRSDLGDLRAFGTHLQTLGGWILVEAKETPRSPSLEGEELTRALLRTAEKDAGLSCSTSGLLHGLDPTPQALPFHLSFLDEGQQEVSMLTPLVRLMTGSGKTSVVLDLISQFRRGVSEANRDGHQPTRTEITHLADTAFALSALLLDIVQRRLNGSVKHFVELVVVPLSESSPCGLLRLAARRVPRAPGAGLIPGPSTFALAA